MRPTSPLSAAVADLAEGFRLSPMWFRLGLEQTWNRYRRTLLGPFWAVSWMLTTGLAISFVFGSLLGGSFREGLPHILGGILCWSLVAGAVADGSGAFLGGAGLMQVQRLPLSFHVMLSTHRVVVNFVHNMIGFMAVMALFRLLTVPHWSLVPAIPLVTLAGLFLAVPVGMLSARYRDFAFLIPTVMGALFLLTPVFWNRAQLPADKRWIADYNPFVYLLEILRQPFLGQPAPLFTWYVALVITAASALIAVISLALFRKRVVFWL